MSDTTPQAEIVDLPDPRTEEHAVNILLVGSVAAAERVAALNLARDILAESTNSVFAGSTHRYPPTRPAAELIELAKYILNTPKES